MTFKIIIIVVRFVGISMVMDVNFSCFRITCDDDEERPSLRTSRGCTRAATCQGCLTCYCKGCIKCRFEDCNCQECRDFMLYAEPQALHTVIPDSLIWHLRDLFITVLENCDYFFYSVFIFLQENFQMTFILVFHLIQPELVPFE